MSYEIRLNNGADVLWPDREKIAVVVKELFPPEKGAESNGSLQAEAAQVVVLNGTPKAGYAERAANLLKARGLTNVKIANANRADYRQTIIIDYADKPATLEAVKKTLNVAPAQVVKEPPDNSNVDLRVIIGAEWVPPQE
jgi:hypothetical protein